MANNLPGPGPMIGLMVAVLLVVWLGVFGPLDVTNAFSRVIRFANLLDANSIIVSFIVAVVVVIAAILVGRRLSIGAANNRAFDEPELQEIKPLFSSADWARFRRYFRLVVGLVGAIALLHFGAAASVLPYVWVSDLSANCGARLVLDRAVGEMMIVLMYILLALFGVVCIGILSKLRILFPELRGLSPPQGIGNKNLLLSQSLVPLSAALLCLGAVLIDDLRFLRNPPNIPTDEAQLKECAHPSETAKWGYARLEM
jgi:hypothetical protein